MFSTIFLNIQPSIFDFIPRNFFGTTVGVFVMFIFLFMLFIVLGIYIYLMVVLKTIAKKLKYKKTWLAWIPIAQLFLIPILAKKKWTWGFLLFIPIVGDIFYYIWTWRIFVKRKYPGFLSLIPLCIFIPFINLLVPIAYLVVIGLVAWADRK